MNAMKRMRKACTEMIEIIDEVDIDAPAYDRDAGPDRPAPIELTLNANVEPDYPGEALARVRIVLDARDLRELAQWAERAAIKMGTDQDVLYLTVTGILTASRGIAQLRSWAAGPHETSEG
jgi:hypothetical protein